MADSGNTIPEDFDPVIRQDGVLLVGGHAVNLWAGYYAGRGDAELAAFAPFTSKDADIFMPDREIALGIAATAGWEFRENPDEAATMPVMAYITLVRGTETLRVEVLRRVTGLDAAELAETEILSLKSGVRYCVPAPEIMLKAKLANAVMIDQKGRQDVRHVRMMVVCCRAYLEDIAQAVAKGSVSAAEGALRFDAVRRVLACPWAGQTREKYGVNVSAALPPREKLGDDPKLNLIRQTYEAAPRQVIKGPGLAP
ncbi:MAG TPA: hypothetical protein VMB21_17385 [Candidatus Limnocylindria bacterium]|nr:hypothetical protein [Candidatus Limnocylindria bacterium]